MAGGGPTPEAPEASLFPIFMLSMVSLVLIPATLFKMCAGSDSEEAKKQRYRAVSDSTSDWGKAAAQQAERLKPSMWKRFSEFCSPGNLSIVAGWLVVLGLVFYIQSLSAEIKPFDPYEIMGIDYGATQKQIKSAYRKLSLQYHPDKNPDPKAAEYFAEFITKAYTALTDEVAKENMEKYGHPDGPQAYTVGIALPAFLFENGKMAPVVLALTVGVGILLPLGLAVCYLINSSKYTSNNVMTTTIGNYNYLMKPMMTLQRVPDVLVYAGEYISRPVPHLQSQAVLKLAAQLRKHYPEVDTKADGAKKFFERRPPAVVRAHLLLLAQTCREGNGVPKELTQEFQYVLKSSPKLLEELIKLAIRPRAPFGYGFYRPTIGVLEMCQSITQAVTLTARKQSEKGNTGDAGMASLLQLPHVDQDVTKKLARKKIKGLSDLMAMSKEERVKVLDASGFTEGAMQDLETTLGTVPIISMSVSCETEGEEETAIMEGDLVTCNCRVRLNRFSNKEAGGGKGSPPSFAPFYPFPRGETWWLVLADISQNALMAAQKVDLEESEYKAPANPLPEPKQPNKTKQANSAKPNKDEPKEGADAEEDAEGGENDELEGDEQKLSVKFQAPPSAVYNLTALLISDFWIGCDKKVAFKLKVGKRTRAEREGRTQPQALVAPGNGSESEAEDEDDYDSGADEVEDYDSEEDYGTEESGSETEGDSKPSRKKL